MSQRNALLSLGRRYLFFFLFPTLPFCSLSRPQARCQYTNQNAECHIAFIWAQGEVRWTVNNKFTWRPEKLVFSRNGTRPISIIYTFLRLNRTILQAQGSPNFSDSFCRLFWVTYVYESDFAMELSMTPPSGITQFEELVPYPASEHTGIDFDTHMNTGTNSQYDMQDNPSPSSDGTHLDLAAFQISTNSAIRRFLNRITAVIYNPAEAWRKQNTGNYTSWLSNITNELQSHHDALHGNLPSFLVSTDPTVFWQGGSPTLPRDSRKFGNHIWNVSRLRGRYCAGQYLITRASFELLLLNREVVEGHPCGPAIMENCISCIKSCVDFIKIFSIEPVNCITNVFATGMA